jgi:hypothetical protein
MTSFGFSMQIKIVTRPLSTQEENIHQLPRDGKKKSDFTREGGGVA